jgi:hypothetical protein
MKIVFSILIFASVLLISNACSNQIEPLPEPEKDVFVFTYNGQTYHHRVEDYASAIVQSYDDKLSISIKMLDVFGGEIYFDEKDCAYLAPEYYKVYHDENCNLRTQSNGHIVPIDSTKVFIFQSGYLNASLTDCQTHTSDLGIAVYTYVTCIASGTFELTLVNNIDETVEITNGTIYNYTVFIN